VLKFSGVVLSVLIYCRPVLNNKLELLVLVLGLGTHLFVKVPRPGDNEGTQSWS